MMYKLSKILSELKILSGPSPEMVCDLIDILYTKHYLTITDSDKIQYLINKTFTKDEKRYYHYWGDVETEEFKNISQKDLNNLYKELLQIEKFSNKIK